MEKVDFGLLMKNIPTPDGKSYKLQVIQKVEDFIKKLKWKTIFFMQYTDQFELTIHKATFSFGLNINKCPCQVNL